MIFLIISSISSHPRFQQFSVLLALMSGKRSSNTILTDSARSSIISSWALPYFDRLSFHSVELQFSWTFHARLFQGHRVSMTKNPKSYLYNFTQTLFPVYQSSPPISPFTALQESLFPHMTEIISNLQKFQVLETYPHQHFRTLIDDRFLPKISISK